MTTRVRVAVRNRPLVEKEKSEGCETCVTVIDDTQILLGKDKCFTYDYVFDAAVSQEDVFQSCGYPLVEAIFKGFNATMLAYGQTGSGKTFTMGSSKIDEDTSEESLGIIPRVVEQLFNIMRDKGDQYTYSIKVSFLEIYNEEIKDLLCTDGQTLAIREDGHGIKIAGLTEHTIEAPTEALNLLCRGGDYRAVGSTKMNETSSRSHAIFTIQIEQQSKTECDDNWVAKFHLVDLAGSERIKKTGAEGERRKEGININLGLLALGNVVSALGDEKRKKNASHIPYRDSKLTRLLQDSLGGNSYTLMMACISPADSNMEETLNTLRYADRAKRIKNKPIVNRDPHVAEILKLKALVSQLQSDAVTGQLNLGDDPVAALEYRKLKEKSELLEEQNERLTKELTNAIDHSNDLCEKIVLMEMSRDKLKARLQKITVDTGITIDELDNSLKDPELKADLRERLEKVKSIQQELCDLEKDKASLECTLSEIQDTSVLTTITELSEECSMHTQSTGHTSTSTLTPDSVEPTGSAPHSQAQAEDSDVYAKTYTLHRAKMSRQLKDLNDMLTAKELLMSESVTAEQRRESMKHQQALEKKIKGLEEEKERLNQQLIGNKSSVALGKISEQRRQRLKELEQQMTELKRKLKEQGKIAQMKEQSDKQLEKLNKEILFMKQQRVRLLKQIKEDSENFRKWKMEQDKKLMQLKAKDRKRDCEMVKMEMQHTKSQAFYKRKAEEAAVANKRLKEALDRQKVSRERHNGKPMEKDLGNIGPRIKGMVNDEIDIMVSIKEAERHLHTQQEQRADLNQQLKSIQSGTATHPHHSDSSDTQARLYQTQLSLCTASISEFNQKLQDARSAKSQPLSERLTSMVEARCAIRHLLSQSVKYKLETLVSESNFKDTSCHADTNSRKIAALEQELTEIEEYHYNEMMIIKKNYDRKLAAMKSQLEEQGGSGSQLDINSMQLDVTSLNEEIEEKDNRIAELERKLKEFSNQRTPCKSNTPRSGLPGERFPTLGIVASPYLDKVSVSAKHSDDTKVKVNTTASRKDNKLTVTSRIQTVAEDDSFLSEDSEVENDDPADLSWHATPEVKQIRRMSSFTKCSCKSACRTKLCGCRAKGRACGPLCGCKLDPCMNDATAQLRRSVTDSTSSVLNKTFDRKSSETTTSTLNSTFSIDKSNDGGDSDDTSNTKIAKTRKQKDTSLLGDGKRRKLHSDASMYFGSPV